MRYYIADLHFFHENLNTKMDKRGFANVNAMNDYMLKQWNSKVRNRDEVVILGDLSWGKSEETNQLLQKLNGRLYLIQGNHDHYVKDPNFDSSRFEWIKMYEELSDNKRKVILSKKVSTLYCVPWEFVSHSPSISISISSVRGKSYPFAVNAMIFLSAQNLSLAERGTS